MLPSSLVHLVIDGCHIASITSLPSGLSVFSANSCLLTALPALPNILTYLSVERNHLTVLPALSSTNLGYLSCSGNSLAGTLPALPSTLTVLTCNDNALTSLPTLPPNLFYFDCSYNQLTILPVLPASLRTLFCEMNSLSVLPALPLHLYALDCSYNPLITSLPDLPPNFYSLICNFDPGLTCLPRIYQNTLNEFFIQGSGITCLPNSFGAVSHDTDPSTMPLCGPASGCDFYYNIAGNIHYDSSATCTLDTLYPGAPVTSMKIQLKENGSVVQQFYSFASGGYSFKVDSLTAYTIDIDTLGIPLALVCPGSGYFNVSLSASDSVAEYENFGMQCSSFDFATMYITANHLRRTFTTYVSIGAGDMTLLLYNADCGAGMSGTVTTTIAGSAQYVSPAPGALTPSYVSGNVLTYNLTDLDSLSPGQLDIIIATDTNAVVGSSVCITTDIESSTPDANFADNSLTQCFNIVNSWDPNSKQVYPLDTFQAGGWLTYTVNFQNTGTDTAYLVVVRDTLSANVDASSFQFLAASSKVVIQLFGSAMVFTFPHINLVDSATNPPLSTGWIQYKVRSLSNLPVGAQVQNTAYVYFDANPAIVTNTTTNLVDTLSSPLGIRNLSTGNSIHLYPNPNKGSFTLETSNNIGSEYTISDMLGNVVVHDVIQTNEQSIDVKDAGEGVYTLVVKGASPVRFVVVR
jgi:uncharacterized repeat protein (TIGR01451 family)